MSRSWLRSLRDGCHLDKYQEMVRLKNFSYSTISYHRCMCWGDVVSAMKKKLEKEAMEQELDE